MGVFRRTGFIGFENGLILFEEVVRAISGCDDFDSTDAGSVFNGETTTSLHLSDDSANTTLNSSSVGILEVQMLPYGKNRGKRTNSSATIRPSSVMFVVFESEWYAKTFVDKHENDGLFVNGNQVLVSGFKY